MGQRERQATPTSRMSPALRCVPYALTVLILLPALASVLAPHALLAWAAAHPAVYARHDPHHWLVRLAALCVLVAYGQFFLREAGRAWRAFRVWQSAFLPWPWGQREPQEAAEAEPPAA